MNLEIVVLAAGFGTRMKSKRAKVLHKICGQEMIFHILKESRRVTNSVGVVLGHQKDEVRRVIEDSFENIKISIQDMDSFPGTGGALMNYPFDGDKVLVLNGDMPLVRGEELKKFFEVDADIVVGIINMSNPDGYGRVVIKKGEVKKIVEQKDADSDELKIDSVNSGIYLFKKDVLDKLLPKLSNANAQHEYYITDLVELAREKKLKVVAIEVDECDFKGVNSKLDLAKAEEIMIERRIEEFSKDGIQFRLPHTIYIEEGVRFEGECEVEPNVVIKGATIIKDSIIKSGSVVEDSYIEGSTVGCMAHIRPNSKIVNSHIGNFVETKKADIRGAKANHLTYLGDCEVGEGSNIGAGTITCNYDGKGKHRTTIGKNVFIGSDTQLVAPVTIEDDVLIAAGSTITKDVTKGSLAISRTPQEQKEGFFYRFFNR